MATAIPLPARLPFPLTVTRILAPVGSQVSRGDHLLAYEYPVDGETGYATFDSPLDGVVAAYGNVKAGTTVTAATAAAGEPVVHIQQACDHPVQFHNMCAVCGVDLSNQDDQVAALNHGVEIEHNESGVTVSLERANTLALSHRTSLLSSRKLVLVIDLDQTIIQTGCDLTIGKWIDECYGQEWGMVHVDSHGRGMKHEYKHRITGPHDPAMLTTPYVDKETEASLQQARERNPNAPALRDVYRFNIPDESAHNNGGTWFYVKPRPGLLPLLHHLAQSYELHVYTAGTRPYANAICTSLDPTGALFHERILSRTESGSASVKNLARLFPTDQSMVVVIDDRWEVWAHSRHLVKVIPYTFFPDVGDINAAFVLPRATEEPPAVIAPPTEDTNEDTPEVSEAQTQAQAEKEAADQVQSQVTEAPLAKRQQELDRQSTEEENTDEPDMTDVHPRAALIDDDNGLDRIKKILEEIHGRFYQSYDSRDRSITFTPGPEPDANVLYDIRHIIPHMRRKVLAGCVICFSAVVPLNQRPQDNEFWILASLFGAHCSPHLTASTTHLVVGQDNTSKVVTASRSFPSTHIVWRDWLKVSVDYCVRQDEERFRVRVGRGGGNGGAERDGPGALVTHPPTPGAGEPVVLPPLDPRSFDDIDAELQEFMDDDDEDDEEDDGDEDDGFATTEPPSPAEPSSPRTDKKRPRRSDLSTVTTPDSSAPSTPTLAESSRTPKRARFDRLIDDGHERAEEVERHRHDEKDDHGNEFEDVVEDEQVEQDWDEYADERGSEEKEWD